MTKKQIRALRKSLGMTQTTFAEAVGVTMDAVRKWEAGRRKPQGPAILMMTGLKLKAAAQQ